MSGWPLWLALVAALAATGAAVFAGRRAAAEAGRAKGLEARLADLRTQLDALARGGAGAVSGEGAEALRESVQALCDHVVSLTAAQLDAEEKAAARASALENQIAETDRLAADRMEKLRARVEEWRAAAARREATESQGREELLERIGKAAEDLGRAARRDDVEAVRRGLAEELRRLGESAEALPDRLAERVRRDALRRAPSPFDAGRVVSLVEGAGGRAAPAPRPAAAATSAAPEPGGSEKIGFRPR